VCNENFIGGPLDARDGPGRLRTRIATAFPNFNTIVTVPGPHFVQIQAMVDRQNELRAAEGLPKMSPEEEQALRDDAVPLYTEGDCVQIRPDPENMGLALKADRLVQKAGFSKRNIKFLNVLNAQVREALKCNGDCWRIATLPTSVEGMAQRIRGSRIAIQGRDIYYYNSTTGTRFLTFHEFCRLGAQEDDELRRHLAEIRKFSALLNSNGKPEIAPFMADASFGCDALAPHDFQLLDGARLRTVYRELRDRFQNAVEPEFREDNAGNDAWRNRMFSALIAETDELVPEGTLLALSPEFFLQVHWLPGGRIVNGELVLDEVFEEERLDPCEENAREFLYNLVREYENLEYVNIGQVVNSLSQRQQRRGRREVYIAVVKLRNSPKEIVSIIRMQKWGVREHLMDECNHLVAIFRSEEYTEYVLDRRLACRYLGMNVPPKITARKICERYTGPGSAANGSPIWSPYFERPYVPGIATDKMPRHKFQNAEFSLRFARLLGLAAAANSIVGKCDVQSAVLFDDGDEVMIEDEGGLPFRLVVTDPSGCFWDFHRPLQETAAAYAAPINRRIEWVPDPAEFARAYVDAFVERFLCIQDKYRRRQRGFDTRFKTRPREDGSFACRWEKVLIRLDQTDPRELAEIIQANLDLRVAGV
jgi:hypothetical protein